MTCSSDKLDSDSSWLKMPSAIKDINYSGKDKANFTKLDTKLLIKIIKFHLVREMACSTNRFDSNSTLLEMPSVVEDINYSGKNQANST